MLNGRLCCILPLLVCCGCGSEQAADSRAATGGSVGVSGYDGIPTGGGTGGELGSGGDTAASGGTGTGGTIATGGVTSAGGTPAAGGASGPGGMTGAGGLPGAGGARLTTDAGSTGGSPAALGPCDIYLSGGTPCVAAHSTVRTLFGAYDGKLYQVRRSSDAATEDIGLLSRGGFADGAAQDAFCSGSMCVITVVYDQTENGNDLWYQGSEEVPGSPQSHPAVATTESLSISGHKVYSLYINPGNSYWRDGSNTGVPTGAEPEGVYMVTSGTHVNGGCCFDYGNSETTRSADAAGAMDAINFSTQCWFGGCSGRGPWVQADLEWGLYPGGSQSWNPNQRAFPSPYVTAMLKNDGTTNFALKGADAQSGMLTTLYDGNLPGGYGPMKKQGAIILGSGGDCCKPNGGANLSAGTFYEGAIVAGYPTHAVDDSIQSNIVSAGYGR